MLKHVLVAVGALALIFAVAATAEELPSLKATIDHPFIANGKMLPAGSYRLDFDSGSQSFSIFGPSKGADAIAVVEGRLSGPMANMKIGEAKLVFDVVGDKYVLSEIWIPNEAGFLVGTERLAKTHSATKARRS